MVLYYEFYNNYRHPEHNLKERALISIAQAVSDCCTGIGLEPIGTDQIRKHLEKVVGNNTSSGNYQPTDFHNCDLPSQPAVINVQKIKVPSKYYGLEDREYVLCVNANNAENNRKRISIRDTSFIK